MSAEKIVQNFNRSNVNCAYMTFWPLTPILSIRFDKAYVVNVNFWLTFPRTTYLSSLWMPGEKFLHD